MASGLPSSLPPVDAVDVVSLQSVDPQRVDRFMQSAADAPFVRLAGDDAERVAALWRRLPPGQQARCHCPPFGLRFYKGGQVICEASICWQCNNIFGQAGAEPIHMEFDGEAEVSRDLLRECELALGESAAD